MKKYKALSSNSVFRIAGKQYITKEGDILELPEEHVTTQALVERGRLIEVPDVLDADEKNPTLKPKTTKK